MIGIAAAPLAVCRHGSTTAHVAALASKQISVVLSAQIEDDADDLAKKKASLGDGAATLFAILPNEAAHLGPQGGRSIGHALAEVRSLIGLSAPPLLEPPLA